MQLRQNKEGIHLIYGADVWHECYRHVPRLVTISVVGGVLSGPPAIAIAE